MDIGSATDIGNLRERNEDAVFVDRDRRLFVVADGLGGHPAGHVASKLAIETIHGAISPEQLANGAATNGLLVDALQEAHVVVASEAANDPAHEGMGTTAVIVHIDPDERAWVAHVGDSRAYLLRDGSLEQVTRDHTSGGGALRGRISQAIGSSPDIDPDVVVVELSAGDRLLLCTDGLTDMLDDGTIERLVEAALERGGRDNITVVVVEV